MICWSKDIFFFEGATVEQVFKDLPKHLTTLAESAAIVGRDLLGKFWKAKAEIDRRVADIQSKTEDTSTTKRTTATGNSCIKQAQ